MNSKNTNASSNPSTYNQTVEELYNRIFSRALKLKEEIHTSISNPDASISYISGGDRGGPAGGLVGDTGMDLPSDDLLLGLDEEANDLDYTIAASFGRNSVGQGKKTKKMSYFIDSESTGESDLYTASETNDSELLDDDLIIEALNSASGKEALKRSSQQRLDERLLAFEDLDEKEGGLDFLNSLTIDEKFMSQLEGGSDVTGDYDDDYDDHNLLANSSEPIVISSTRKRQQQPTSKAEETTKHRLSPNSLSFDTVTALGRVHSIRINISKLELKSTLFSPMTTTFAVEYMIPDLISQDGRQFFSRISSSSLPRLASSIVARPTLTSSSASGGPSSTQPVNCLIPFDHNDIYPIIFDGAGVETWLASTMSLTLTATHSAFASRNGPGGRAPASSSSTVSATQRKKPVGNKLWEAHGTWKCREVVMAGDFYWTGRIPVWSSDETLLRKIANGNATLNSGMLSQSMGRAGMGNAVAVAAAAKERATAKHVGDLLVSVELVTTGGFSYKSPNSSTAIQSKVVTNKKGSVSNSINDGVKPTSNEMQDSTTHTVADVTTKAPSAPLVDPMLNNLTLPPFYYHVQITTARGLAIFSKSSKSSSSDFGLIPSTPSPSTLLYLIVRLFTSSAPTSTPPIPYFPPFDLTTGKLNPPPNFDYSATLPIAITQALVNNHRESPMIVEVWTLDISDSKPSPPSSSKDKGKDGEDGSDADEQGGEENRKGSTLHTDDGAKLLGLLKLPFNHLLNTVAAAVLPQAGKEKEANVDSGDYDDRRKSKAAAAVASRQSIETLDVPVMIPETEYAIIDPFTGASKGWIKAFLALGTWDQILKVRRSGSDVGGGGKSDKKNESKRYDEEEDAFVRRNRHEDKVGRRRDKQRQKLEDGFMDRIEGRKSRSRSRSRSRNRKISPNRYENTASSSDYAEASSSESDAHHCEIEVKIHGACGIGALLDSLISKSKVSQWMLNRENKSHHKKIPKSSTYTPLDYAKDVGANVYVVFRLFPKEFEKKYVPKGYTTTSAKTNVSHSSRSSTSATVITSVVAHTFAPKYDTTNSILIRSIGSDLLQWMKQGGAATGELWHSIPKSEGGFGSQSDVLLGTFKVPLVSIIGRPSGIDGVWVSVEPATGDDASSVSTENIVSAIQISIKVKSGLEFGEAVENGSIGVGRTSSWSCQLKIELEKARIPPKTDPVDNEVDPSGTIFGRWRYPVMKPLASLNASTSSDASAIQFVWRETAAYSVGQLRSDGLHHLDFAYSDSVDLDMKPPIIKSLSTEKFIIELRRLPRGKRKTSESELVGTASIDMWEVMQKIRKNSRKNATGPVKLSVTVPLIDPTSDDLKGARITVKLELSVIPAPPTPAKPPARGK
jgi:hypothetical protein